MTQVLSIGTYLPPWTVRDRRVKGPDEDALTMAVAAGRAADPDATAERVVLVSRDFPLLEGGNGAVLLAALSLPADTAVTEVLGGAPAVLDQIGNAGERTLVIAADDNDLAAGAGAVLTGDGGASVTPLARQTRSLPLTARGADGARHSYVDPRLQREVGVRSTLARLGLAPNSAVAAVAGVPVAQVGGDFDTSHAVGIPTVSATAIILLLADAIEAGAQGLLIAVEQSSVSAADLAQGGTTPRIARDEFPARELPKTRVADGVGIPISMPAYARAFEPKIRWEAAVFEESPGIDTAPQFPPRLRVDNAGRLATEYRLESLPRTGTVYTHTTVRIPVPDLPSPYSLAVVQLDDSPVRVLLKVTGVPAGEATIGQPGSVVLRRIATRTGIPDYGYAFWPGRTLEGAVA
ncbi:OB-fold domain-containing protein [Mycobacterium intracellulare]|uniref:OB-fold domain-containing protein n=1 Tax=Mycobacterium intracellulare TaxID=1767 RepID=A0AAE4UBI0_MYCIT|nr:OB-fold domain-containing protein [Mycobacterium intracellulare]MDV6977011.1 OB-fold domain-containing protein [Mycobacterium intracellulare]MDV6982308.1 OB-fold domain-containing protein [Mycobacterium intracellulare]MDV7011907.1 OB-fold domain-containing protein [Mycobacterium intracellulare]MDV7026843.1 OB-fold domain-containing protein [Mycobacterium intracellulare]